MTQASIITIGDELLIGQVVDTNSAWMAQELNKWGIRVKRRVAVGDVWDEIWQALDEEKKQTDIILITGGLGPTADDITKPLLCKYFNGSMIVDEGARQNVINIFTRLNRPMIERNLKQAEVPDVCTVIPNKRGTAPGMWFEKDGKVFVSMPGVPHEMKGMMETDVIPMLLGKFRFPAIIHRTLLTAGVGESFLAEHIKDFEASLPEHIRLAYLPNYGMVRLRLTATGAEKEQTERDVQTRFETLQSLVKEYMVTNEDEPIEKTTGRILEANNKTMCTAESCTGGYIAHLITSIPGSSAFYKGSVVSYANEIKKDLLGVEAETLQRVGAVSEEVVIQMAKGALAAMKTDYAIAVSGIMGPDGGSAEKPVGTVWVAIGSNQKVEAHKLSFRFDRMRNIQLTTANALNLLRKFILAGN
ncbi:MAG TPA: competence/damage-inducible protein A [Ferruginibacter sp.]|jgi:nicotinamide-nucleotide amidase|nr:competence/damage-inducible protein A [Ferruginibacter sp.]HNA00538.1 competence/damage-inducible protein A [Ferruginibacter sp.]HNF01721.1 competence/damage-inducible protein A [Ferruginibacter sp.]HNJ28172.1 competence/damage-inducible protein A [Ferruginibacter sp.]HNL65761.1 competence/damage-inducible protein A [Ferruginibacter sp.]